jgi:hypothetical protein
MKIRFLVPCFNICVTVVIFTVKVDTSVYFNPGEVSGDPGENKRISLLTTS